MIRLGNEARLDLLEKQQESFESASRSSQNEGGHQLGVPSALESPGWLGVIL